MTLGQARVIPQAKAWRARLTPGPAGAAGPAPQLGRASVLPKVVAEARARAAALLLAAREEAKRILAQAQAQVDDMVLQQQARARADALCLVVAEALELRKRQAELSKSTLERSIGFATLLAERLLGEELRQSPERVRELARQALKEAAGARQAVIVANPADAAQLRSGLLGLGELLDSIGIEEDPRLGVGQLRVETELGVIDAELKGQLERLAGQLKKLLESHAAESL